MKNLLTTLSAAALSMSFVSASFLPAEAAPAFVPKAPDATSDVIKVQERYYPGPRPGPRPVVRPGPRPNFYYNGYRGYRAYRPGYRYYNNAWYPAAAFITGAIIGGALNNGVVNEGPVRSYGNAHVEWCYDRYRSYRAYDNTFQPYNGPRQQCYSPYS
jgi:hypothetical protein